MVDRIFIEDETLRQGFTQIPNSILRHPDISPGAKLTYMVLLSYAWQEGSCFPGQLRMAEDMGAGERSVRRYLKELEAAGLLLIKQRGLGKTNLYILPTYRPANLADQDRPELPPQDRPNRPTKNTQRKGTSIQNKKDTQLTEDERAAYFQQLAEDNADHLAAFLRTDNPDYRENEK